MTHLMRHSVILMSKLNRGFLSLWHITGVKIFTLMYVTLNCRDSESAYLLTVEERSSGY